MRKKLLIGSTATVCLLCAVLCGVVWGYPALLTLLHGRALKQALQHYWDVRHSVEAFEDPSILSEVAVGKSLTTTMGLYRAFDEPPQLELCRVTTVWVEEYHPRKCSRVSAQVTCGGTTGEYIFLWHEDRWKVANFWQWLDTHNTLWPSSPPPTCRDFLGP